MQVEYQGYTIEVEDIEIGNEGIGSYEYWGARYNDSRPYLEDYRITAIWNGEDEIVGEAFERLKESLKADNKFEEEVLDTYLARNEGKDF